MKSKMDFKLNKIEYCYYNSTNKILVGECYK